MRTDLPDTAQRCSNRSVSRSGSWATDRSLADATDFGEYRVGRNINANYPLVIAAASSKCPLRFLGSSAAGRSTYPT
jgi:hypothetical protein